MVYINVCNLESGREQGRVVVVISNGSGSMANFKISSEFYYLIFPLATTNLGKSCESESKSLMEIQWVRRLCVGVTNNCPL